MNLPFLDGALAALPVQDGFETSSLATDAKALYFSGAWLAQRFERSRTSVNRAYLHTVFHCLLRHPAKMRGRDRDLWSLACDIAVESLLDSLDYRCLAPDKTSVRRRSLYRSLHEHMPVLTAEAVYRHFRRERMNSYDCATLTRVFAVDEHTLWPEDDDDQDRRWQQQAQRTQTAMDTVFASEATGGEAVREQLAVSARRTTDYRAFLRRFSALREETAIDADSFDYGYYAYGLRRYGNMPLIEPLETRETRKIEDFVIAIDTSMSTSGELVRAFLERTCELLQQNTSFFRRINLRILQCDDKLRSDKVIHDAKEFADYMAHFELIGQSATDFRPVFEHVDRLVAEGAFHSLRGLIYFTDGLGLYPKKAPEVRRRLRHARGRVLAGQRSALGHPRHPPRGRNFNGAVAKLKFFRQVTRPGAKGFFPAPGRSLYIQLIWANYLTISFAAAARTSTFASASALFAPLAMIYTLTLGSVPDGRMIKVVPPSSS